jgi:transcription elongation factor GreA-like protein
MLNMITENKISVKSYFTSQTKKKLNSWEREFITSLYNSKKEWSSKQLETFNNIVKKYKLVKRNVVNVSVVLPSAVPGGYTKRHYTNEGIMKRNMLLTGDNK